MEQQEESSTEYMVNANLKTLPTLRFNEKLEIQNEDDSSKKEPFGSESADRYFQKQKLPPLKSLVVDPMKSHVNTDFTTHPPKKKKKRRKVPKAIDTGENNVIVNEEAGSNVDATSRQSFELGKYSKFKDETIENKNGITKVKPATNLDTVGSKESDKQLEVSDDNSNSSTITYTVHQNPIDVTDKNEKLNRGNSINSNTSNSTYPLDTSISKRDALIIKNDSEELRKLSVSEDSLTPIIKEKEESLNSMNKPDYRKIALDLAANKGVKIESKRLKRYCDFVLVYDLQCNDLYRSNERSLFESLLEKEGLDIIKTTIGSNVFVEIYASFYSLCKEAESIYLHMSLKGCKLDQNMMGCVEKFFKSMKTDNEVDRISAPFSYSTREMFYGIDDEQTFFRSAYRSMLTRHILNNIKISLSKDGTLENCHEKGIDSLLHSGSYKEAFILHDRSELDSQFPINKEWSSVDHHTKTGYIDSRKELHNTWLKCVKWQPLWKIRNYFGEEIGLYFAWLGVLITSLIIPSVLGIVVFAYGTIKVFGSGDKFMFSKLKVWMSNSMDNEITPYFALIICLWGSVFLEVWKRKRAELSYQWDVDSFEEQEPNRPQFYGTTLAKDPITGELEPYYPFWRKILKSMGSLGIIIFMVLLVVVSVVSVVVYKVVSRVDWFATIPAGSIASSITSSILNSLSILILGRVYKWLAYKLTDWENHQTRTQHEDSLTMKLFGFQFVNSYCSLFYIAFFRESQTDSQGIMELGSKYTDTCGENNDCMSELTVQVAVLMIMKPMPKFFNDIILPWFKKHVKRCCCRGKSQVSSEDYKDTFDADIEYERYLKEEYKKPPLGDFTLSEYTEKVLQYGYLMLFASAFPLAPLIALITNAIDLRVDARRMLWFNQRPVPQRAQDIGIWFTILSFLNYAGMLTNAFILGITSHTGHDYFYETFRVITPGNFSVCPYNFTANILPSNLTSCEFKIRTSDNVWIIVIFENIVLAVKVFLQYVIPDVPESVSKARKQEKRQLELLLAQSGFKSGPGKTIQKTTPTKKLESDTTEAGIDASGNDKRKRLQKHLSAGELEGGGAIIA